VLEGRGRAFQAGKSINIPLLWSFFKFNFYFFSNLGWSGKRFSDGDRGVGIVEKKKHTYAPPFRP
jgi:hypothetical protein